MIAWSRPVRVAAAAVLLSVALVSACRPPGEPTASPSETAPVVLFFGDSITAGLGLEPDVAFPALLERKLLAAGFDFRCVNAGVSGDTTEAASRRMTPYLEDPPRVVIVELGANDAFRGVPRIRTQQNLVHIVTSFRDAGAHVIVAGTLFPDMNPIYSHAMERVYERVAKVSGATYLRDLLDGVAGNAELNLPDQIHPNAAGHRRIADTAWPLLERTLASLR